MPGATWNGEVIVESDATVVVERNPCSPRAAVRARDLEPGEGVQVEA